MTDGVSLTAAAQPATTSTEATGAAVAGNSGNTQTSTTAPTQQTPPAGVTLSQQPTQTQTDQTQAADSPFAGLSPEFQELAKSKGWKSLEDPVKGYKELETKLSSTRPADTPANVADYDPAIKPPANAADIGYNDDFAKWFKQAAFESKVPVSMVQGLHDSFVKYAGEQVVAARAAQEAQITQGVSKAAQSLQELWGAPNNPKFARSLDMSMRAINNLAPGLKEALIEVGAIAKVGGNEMVVNATIIDAFSKVGSAMYAEDTLYGSVADNANPFDPKTLDLGMQARILKQDKGKAQQLIRSLPAETQQRYARLLAS